MEAVSICYMDDIVLVGRSNIRGKSTQDLKCSVIAHAMNIVYIKIP